MTHFNTKRFEDAAAIWQSSLKARKSLLHYLKRASVVMIGNNSRGWVKALSSYSWFVICMIRTQGVKGLCIYLKASNLALIRVTAGRRLEHSRLAGVAVSMTNQGIPRVIVPSHRARIRAGDSSVIRFYLGLFTLYRVLPFRGKLTLESIVRPGVDISDDLITSYKKFLRVRFIKYLKEFDIFPLRSTLTRLEGREAGKETWCYPQLEADRKVILTSGPNSSTTKSASVFNILHDCLSFVGNPRVYNYLHAYCLVTGNSSILDMVPFRLARALDDHREDDRQKAFAGERYNCAYLWNVSPEQGLGRLSIREEPGKLRVFAMVDSLTQWVLYPLHKLLFSWLAKIPQDGTFNQVSPVKDLIGRLKARGERHVWSYDLSAATDRIPVLLQEILLGYLVGQNFAYYWRRLLCERFYEFPKEWKTTFGSSFPKETVETGTGSFSVGSTLDQIGDDSKKLGRDQNGPYAVWRGSLVRDVPFPGVKYAVGQPMGAYSSWAMLAFVHHALVQFAAFRAGKKSWFTEYAVLGDDVVIADRDVAPAYVSLMKEIGVDIGFHKSVISNNLSLEFAKRYFYKGEEVTPMPLLGIAVGWLGSSMVPEVISASERVIGRTISFYNIAKYLGLGYKAASAASNREFTKLPKRLLSVLILLCSPGAPRGVDDWFQWIRLGTADKTKIATGASRDALVRFVLDQIIRKRFDALLARVDKTLDKFLISESTRVLTSKRWNVGKIFEEWFELYIKQPLRQDLMISRMNIEGLLRGIGTIIMPSENEVIKLLDQLVEFEKEIDAIPKEMVRHKSQLAETSIPLWPGMVKRWLKLAQFVTGREWKRRKIVARVGTGGSPLLRVK